MIKRCLWAEANELFFDYHDNQWGTPTHDERMLFEILNLEGAQAGLSWLTIIKKRGNYKKVFDNFDAEKISKYDESKKESLLKDKGIIRNRLKINAVIENAKAFLKIQKDFGSFDNFIWQYTKGNYPELAKESISTKLSKDLKNLGFKFVGPTICYSYMQAIGLINDHEETCFRYKELI